MAVTLYNPPVSFLGGVDGNMQPGKMVKIQGIVPHSTNRYIVNLKCGPNDEDDIALHMSIRFPENMVVINSLLKCHWGPEERYDCMPFTRGSGFELLIFCDPEHFKIAVNGAHFTEYTHRMPYERVTNLQIQQDMQIQWEGVSTLVGTPLMPGSVIPPPSMGNPPPYTEHTTPAGYSRHGAPLGSPGYTGHGAPLDSQGYTGHSALPVSPGYPEHSAPPGSPAYPRHGALLGSAVFPGHSALLDSPAYPGHGALLGSPAFPGHSALLGSPAFPGQSPLPDSSGYFTFSGCPQQPSTFPGHPPDNPPPSPGYPSPSLGYSPQPLGYSQQPPHKSSGGLLNKAKSAIKGGTKKASRSHKENV